MKKNNMNKLGGWLVTIIGMATAITAAYQIGGDDSARPNTKATVSEKQAIFKEFCPSDPKKVAIGLFGTIATIAGIGLINKKEK